MESNLSYGLIFIISLIGSAIFSCIETALTSIPETYFRKIVEERKGFIKAYNLWLTRPNRVLTAIIVGNNLFNTLAAVVATVFAQALFSHYVISISTACVTLLLLIFGEITPKTFARHNARAVISWTIYLIYPIYFILFPLVWVLSHLAVFLVRLMGGHIKREGPMATKEDIAYLIRLSHEEGVFKPEQSLMLQSVIAFRDISAREIMVPRTNLFSFAINTPFEEVITQVAQQGFTRWPVYIDDIDNIVGIFYVKDLINVQINNKEFHLKDHLRKTMFIPESMKLDNVLREFQKKKAHLAVVVDEYGGTAGIVTLEDILEEIVGEIRDEYDKEEEERTITRIGVDHFLAEGRTSIQELQRMAGITLPTDDSYETLGGFLVLVFEHIPKKNAEYVFENWLFRVVEVEEKRIIKVEIMKMHTS